MNFSSSKFCWIQCVTCCFFVIFFFFSNNSWVKIASTSVFKCIYCKKMLNRCYSRPLFMLLHHAGSWAGLKTADRMQYAVRSVLLLHWEDRQSAGQRSRGLYGRSLLRARWWTDTRGQYSKHFHKSSSLDSTCLYLPLAEHVCCSSKAVFVHWGVLNPFLKQYRNTIYASIHASGRATSFICFCVR